MSVNDTNSADTAPDAAGSLCPVKWLDGRPEITLDLHGRHYSRHNYAIYDELRAKCPVAYSTGNQGVWLLTDYESTFTATRDDDLFTSTPGTGIPRTDYDDGQSIAGVSPPIHTDPPLTAAMRKLTQSFLTPGKANDAEPEIRAIATELIDGFIEKGEADIIGELTTPLPARVILRMLGFDEDRWPEWVSYVHGIVHGNHDDPEGLSEPEAGERMSTAIMAEMERRATGTYPADDLTGTILAGEVLGRPLTVEEKFGYILLLLFGGMDTTSGLTGNTLVQLCRHPELRKQLTDSPELMQSAVEEFLRHGSPTQGLGRTVSRDAEFYGQQLKAGDRVLLLWGAANRDPSVFEDPIAIDLERSPNRHMAFGVGQHRCLGSNFARTMFRVMLEEILTRLPDFRMVDDEPRVFADASSVYAPRELRITFTPGPKRTR